MKKILLSSMIVVFTSCGAYAYNPTYSAPNASTLDFYPLMMHQMDKEEFGLSNTSDKIEHKTETNINENKVRSSNFNPNYTPNYGGTYLHPVHPVSMQFTRGDDGTIKIQGIHSNSQTIKSTEKSEK